MRLQKILLQSSFLNFSQFSCYLISVRSKYPPQYRVLKHFQFVSPLMEQQKKNLSNRYQAMDSS
jgi:hypothetical protein